MGEYAGEMWGSLSQIYVFIEEVSNFFAPIWWFLPLGSLDVHDLMYAQI